VTKPWSSVRDRLGDARRFTMGAALIAALAHGSGCDPTPVALDAATSLDAAPSLDAERIIDAPELPGDALVLPGDAPELPGDAPVPPGDAPPTACRSDRECSAMMQVCDRTSGTCVDCTSTADCAEGEACLANACAAVMPCTSSRQCPGRVCAPALGYCVECNEDLDCAAEAVCRDHVCVARPLTCVSSRECSALGQVCDAALGVCVECTSALDCFGVDERCDRSDVVLGGRCAPRICEPGATSCVGLDAARTCATDGGEWTEVPCGASQSCVAGRC